MNEKIKELAKLAAEKTCSLDFERIWDERTWHRVYNEQFAELIIKECANACLKATTEDSPVHLVSVAYADNVKKHFGVE